MTVFLLISAVVAAVCWVCASPVRLVAAGGVLVVTHPVPTFALTAVTSVAVTVAAAVFTVRTVRAEGWHLVAVYRPAFAQSRAGGVAS